MKICVICMHWTAAEESCFVVLANIDVSSRVLIPSIPKMAYFSEIKWLIVLAYIKPSINEEGANSWTLEISGSYPVGTVKPSKEGESKRARCTRWQRFRCHKPIQQVREARKASVYKDDPS